LGGLLYKANMNKLEEIIKQKEHWVHCEACPLHQTRRNVVFGEGNLDAKILIVGEGPGAEEDKTGYPFQGEAGQILDKFLQISNLSRDEIYITNCVGCRPTAKVLDEKTGRERTENRPPTKDERLACKQRLIDIIYTIDPYVIVAMGKTAVQNLLGKGTSISNIRGRIQTMHFPGKTTEIRYAVLPMYHPAFLARSLDYRESGPWGQTSKDFVTLCGIYDYLNEQYHGIKPPKRQQIEVNESHDVDS
jgi:uracil-DNA glycosylase family 4